MESLVNYGSSDEEDNEEIHESHLDSKRKKQINFKVPIQTSKLKIDKEEEVDEEVERPRKKSNLGEGTLSFLPAPKNVTTSQIDTKFEKKETITYQTTTNTVGNDDETEEKDKKIKLSFKHIPLDTLSQEEQESLPQDEASVPNDQVKLTANEYYNYANVEDPNLYNQYYQPTYDPSQYQQYQAYSQDQQYYQVDNSWQIPPTKSKQYIPKEFRDIKNIIEIKQDDMRKDWPKYDEEKFQLPPEMMPSQIHDANWTPSRAHRRQNHLTMLMWDMRNKAGDLERKRMEGIRTRRETRAKYGW